MHAPASSGDAVHLGSLSTLNPAMRDAERHSATRVPVNDQATSSTAGKKSFPDARSDGKNDRRHPIAWRQPGRATAKEHRLPRAAKTLLTSAPFVC